VLYYPVYLNLQKRKAVVIGGGRVAERKVKSLLKAGASVTVISPELTGGLLRLREKGSIRHHERAYRKGDLGNALVVIAATDSEAVNTKIAREAPALVNVVDVPKLCNFIAPSVVQRGPLNIAISTSGASPALSRSIRRELELLYGPGIALYLAFVGKIRARALREIQDRKRREAFLKRLGSAGMLGLLRKKGFQAAKAEISAGLQKLKV